MMTPQSRNSHVIVYITMHFFYWKTL